MSSELPISSPYRSTPDAPVTESEREQVSSRLNAAFTSGELDQTTTSSGSTLCSARRSSASWSRWSKGCRPFRRTRARRSSPAPAVSPESCRPAGIRARPPSPLVGRGRRPGHPDRHLADHRSVAQGGGVRGRPRVTNTSVGPNRIGADCSEFRLGEDPPHSFGSEGILTMEARPFPTLFVHTLDL